MIALAHPASCIHPLLHAGVHALDDHVRTPNTHSTSHTSLTPSSTPQPGTSGEPHVHHGCTTLHSHHTALGCVFQRRVGHTGFTPTRLHCACSKTSHPPCTATLTPIRRPRSSTATTGSADGAPRETATTTTMTTTTTRDRDVRPDPRDTRDETLILSRPSSTGDVQAQRPIGFRDAREALARQSSQVQSSKDVRDVRDVISPRSRESSRADSSNRPTDRDRDRDRDRSRGREGSVSSVSSSAAVGAGRPELTPAIGTNAPTAEAGSTVGPKDRHKVCVVTHSSCSHAPPVSYRAHLQQR